MNRHIVPSTAASSPRDGPTSPGVGHVRRLKVVDGVLSKVEV